MTAFSVLYGGSKCMCGIIGAYGHDNVVLTVYNGLITVQHRGQDAAGIVTYNKKFHLKKGLGNVEQIFSSQDILRLDGTMGIGQVRYPTVGAGTLDDAQPFIVNHPYGIAMVHNGNVSNYTQLKKELFQKDLRMLESGCDVEAILNVFASALQKKHLLEPTYEDFFDAVKAVFERVKGAYSVIAMIADKGMLVFRDPYGIRPLVYGTKKKDGKTWYMFSSESVSLEILNYEVVRDVKPEEAIFIDHEHTFHTRQIAPSKHYPCIFEYVYFARADSVIDGISVYKTRLRLGDAVTEQWKQEKDEIDVVMPIPESPKPAALTLAFNLGKKYREGLLKHRYIGRTFIMPGQEVRKNSLKQKLNPIRLEIEGKKILLVDDSIVRGNTSRQIVTLLKATGAKKIFFSVYSPPIRYPCVYGIDISSSEELVAHGRSVEQIRKEIGADKLKYLPLEEMEKACREGNPEIQHFCTACFSGKYPTGDITPEMFEDIKHDKRCMRNT